MSIVWISNKRAKGTFTKLCPSCQKTFQAKRENTISCSEACKKIRAKKKYLEKYQKWIPIEKKCDYCNTKFLPRDPNHKRCSKQCGIDHQNSYTRKTPPPREIYCLECEEKFIQTQSVQKFCSKNCRTIYYKHTPPSSMVEIKKNRFLVLKRDNFQCIYCGKSSIEDATELHIDHILPRSIGGSNFVSNLVTSCEECNVAKGDIILKEDKTKRILAEVVKRNLKNDIRQDIIIKF